MKTQRFNFLMGLVIGAFLIHGAPALADQYTTGANTFVRTVREAQEICRTPAACEQAGLRTVVLYDAKLKDATQLNEQTLGKLKEIAADQAMIWADTILEGDYVADGKTQVEAVEGLYRGHELLAYRVTYAERGWFVGECDYDWNQDTDPVGCQEGVIREATFVAPDFTNWMRDDMALVDFVGL